MSKGRILTMHPSGKKGVNISKQKYDVISQFIIKVLNKRKEISFKELTELAVENLQENFDGNITWYLVTIKLDLEARKIIERIPNVSPQRIRKSYN